ncbi:hypothetical protein VOLCADRAFT_92807 [Volvox carteri f. nagariensis]|uniref:Uncharacterized protein n=1 Tax=Volvox carteri f. nagariensis TaxID=3068 RepID=D8U0I5_VOLCA|nr:uncharacterized protein VOLCADRAFT_92807 [Volvox carteri f. nagariensis]EFJ46641.1 hypothetical protein VOLCADRAFT_92807 [Volvox carteri f. nagariensis]|eukprot:XP_002952170.1 hypothetical protein VOLCADRAFT_92807 [Volvox carteri f. nagariensis]
MKRFHHFQEVQEFNLSTKQNRTPSRLPPKSSSSEEEEEEEEEEKDASKTRLRKLGPAAGRAHGSLACCRDAAVGLLEVPVSKPVPACSCCDPTTPEDSLASGLRQTGPSGDERRPDNAWRGFVLQLGAKDAVAVGTTMAGKLRPAGPASGCGKRLRFHGLLHAGFKQQTISLCASRNCRRAQTWQYLEWQRFRTEYSSKAAMSSGWTATYIITDASAGWAVLVVPDPPASVCE